MAGSLLLASCHMKTSSPLDILVGSPKVFSQNDTTFILVPLDITDKGSRTLRIHLRHSLIDLSSGGMHFRVRGSDTYTFILHHADKPFPSIYPSSWSRAWVDHDLSHKDVVVPAETRKAFPLLFVYQGKLESISHMTLHLVYSYPQTATNDETLLDVPVSAASPASQSGY